MIFQNPTYLWGFLALAIPLAIHFLNRGEVKVVKVGSIKFLKEHETTQTKNIRLNELVLLALRMLALGLVVLIMAQPQIAQKPSNTSLTYLVEPSLVTHEMLKSFLSKIPNGTDIKLLSNGFPDMAEYEHNDIEKKVNYWQLVQELETLPTDSIVIFASGLLENVKGMRPETTKNSNWILLGENTLFDGPIAAFANEDKYQLIKQTSDERNTSFEVLPQEIKSDNIKTIGKDSLQLIEQEKSTTLPIVTKDSVRITIVFDEAFKNESLYFEAACKAILRYAEWPGTVHRLEKQANLDLEDLDLLIWLNDNKSPKYDGPQISYKFDEVANRLLQSTTAKNRYHLTQRLNLKVMEEGKLVSQLANILNLDLKVREIVALDDRRLLPKEELMPIYVDKASKKFEKESKDVSNWLWFVLLPVLVTERILAKHRKQ